MRRADRLFQIIQYLRTRRITTAKWLAEKLAVSERTIYRDIQDLMLCGVQIEGEVGMGYVMRHGFDLPPLMFTTEEMTALTLGARIVTSFADRELGRAAASVLSKVESALPDTLKGWSAQTRLFAPFTQVSTEVAAALFNLRMAIEKLLIVNMQYVKLDGQQSYRAIWPLGLFFWGKVWTLSAWCEKRDAFRNFRLDRIHGLTVTDEHYPDTTGKTLADMLAFEKKLRCGP